MKKKENLENTTKETKQITTTLILEITVYILTLPSCLMYT